MKTNLKTVFALITLLSSIVSPAMAEKTNWWVMNQNFTTDYYESIVGGIFYDGPQSQTDLSYNLCWTGGTTSIGTWIGRPLDSNKYGVNFGDEVDLYLTHTFPIQGFGDLKVGTAYYAMYHMDRLRDDIQDFFVRLDINRCKYATPYIEVDNFIPFSGAAPAGGSFLFFGAYKNIPLSERIGIVIDARTGYSLGCFSGRWGFEYQRLSIAAPIQLSKPLTLVPKITGQIPLGKDRAFADRERLFAEIALVWVFGGKK